MQEPLLPRSAPSLRVFTVVGFAVAMLGLQLQWSIIYIFLVPNLLESGVGPSLASGAWLFSPAFQIFAAPALSAWSDRLSVRKPFIAVLTLISASILVGLPLLRMSGLPRPALAVLTVAANVALDAANSISEELQRAFASDATRSSRALAVRLHAAVAGACGVGSGIGYLLGGFDYSAALHHLPALRHLTDQAALCWLAALLFVGGSLALLLVPAPPPVADSAPPSTTTTSTPANPPAEPPRRADIDGATALPAQDGGAHAPHAAAGRRAASPPSPAAVRDDATEAGVFEFLVAAPRGFRLLCMQQTVAWIGLWPLWILGSAFFAHDVFRGSATASAGSAAKARYDAGVRAGAFANAAMAFTCVAASVVLPAVARAVGRTRAYVGGQLLSAAALICLGFARETVPAVALAAVGGIAWALNNTVPFAAVPDLAPASHTALATTVLYLSQTVPQILVSLTFGPIVAALGGTYAVSPILAGVALAVSAAMMPFVARASPASAVVHGTKGSV